MEKPESTRREPVVWSVELSRVLRYLGMFRIPYQVREELAQEAAVRCLGAPGVRSPRAWMRRVAHNLAVSWLRARREEPWPDEERGSARWEREVEARLDASYAVTALQGAPMAYRDFVVRHYLEQVGLDELIAQEQALGEPSHRVRARMYKRRARSLAWARLRLDPT